jgi:RND family efflux transporter MFP subunit
MRQRDFEIKVERLRQAVRLAAAEQRNARVDLENATVLVKRGGLSQEQLDDRRTRYEATTAQRGIAQADLAEAELALADATTRAPYNGVITQRNVDEGAFVSSFMRTSEPVMQIQKIDIMVAVIFVPEVHLGSIKLGTPGKITIPSLNKSYKSEVALINDRLDLQTRSIDVRLGIQNKDYAIKPGLFIEVELYPDSRAALTLPKNTLRGLGGDRYVFVVENGLAKRRSVEIRELENDQVEVLSGIEDSTLVIQGSNLKLVQDNTSVIYGAPS